MMSKAKISHCGTGAPRDGRNERGAVAIIVALALVTLLAFILLAVQVGDVGMVRGLLQGSADQAALAGARQLNGTNEGITEAQGEAMEMLAGGKNFPQAVNMGSDLNISGPSTQTGTWDFDNPQAGFDPSTDPLVANAVRVIAKKTAEANQEVPMFLGGFLGPETVPVARQSIAALGNTASLPCRPELPIAACAEDTPCGQEAVIVTSDSTEDNGCWTGFFSVANANDIRDFIQNCGTVPHVEVDDLINLNNGNLAQPAYGSVEDELTAYQTSTGQTTEKINDTDDPLDKTVKAVCTGTGNVHIPDLENPSCNADCGARLDTEPVDINGDGVVTTADCGMPRVIPMIPSASCASSCNQTGPVTGFAMFVITQVRATKDPKFIRGFPLCGVHIPGAPTGPGPWCSPERTATCPTEPILVNKDLL